GSRFGKTKCNSRDLLKALGNRTRPGQPLFPLCSMITLMPHLGGNQHTYDLFAAYFKSTAKTMVGAGIHAGGDDQIFPADQQTGTLRSTEVFAATISYQVCSLGNMRVRYFKSFRCRIHQDRNSKGFGDR